MPSTEEHPPHISTLSTSMTQERKIDAQPENLKEPYLRSVVDRGVENLLAELEQGRSERLEQYLTFTSRFHRYSFSNQMLIFQQCPNATHVAGYRTWQKLDYHVAKGQKGIRILAPRTYTRVDAQSREEETATYFVDVA